MDINNIWNSPHNYSIFCNMKVNEPTKVRDSYRRDEFLQDHKRKVSEFHSVQEKIPEGDTLEDTQVQKMLDFLAKRSNIRKNECVLITKNEDLQEFYDKHLKHI